MNESGANIYSDALANGAQLGGFILQRVLGQGGFGITYQGYNPVTRRNVAIKEFFPLGAARRGAQSQLIYSQADTELTEWALRKFRETTTTLCELEHPNIVRVFDYVPANDTGYMVMELLDGATLKDWLLARKEPPSLQDLYPIVDPVMDALAYIHKTGLIHRDIAPDNIQITSTGRPVLIDFGSVSVDLTLAQHRHLSGTVSIKKEGYTAPEQIVTKSKPAPSADIYSMGAVLYQALSGSAPIDGKARVDSAFFSGADPYIALAERNLSNCPPVVARAIDEALSIRPEHRPGSMAEFHARITGAHSDSQTNAVESFQVAATSVTSPFEKLSAPRVEVDEFSPAPSPSAGATGKTVPWELALGDATTIRPHSSEVTNRDEVDPASHRRVLSPELVVLVVILIATALIIGLAWLLGRPSSLPPGSTGTTTYFG